MKDIACGEGIASPAAPSPARHGGCKNTATAAPLALCYENARAATCLPCAPPQRTPFSSRAGWAEGPSNTPATKRYRDLPKEAVALLQPAGKGSSESSQGHSLIFSLQRQFQLRITARTR